jgi:aspartyl-tRNA(Asn)/glutamyl-tRNA(Gln) amidotransferase subunit A
MCSAILDYSALELRDMICTGEVSPVELIQESLSKAEKLQDSLNLFMTLTPELALKNGRQVEAEIQAGKSVKSLAGLPISVKDIIPVKDVRFTCGSLTMADTVADVDAVAVERLKAVNASIIGKTTTAEFGAKAMGDSPLSGITRNPWNINKTPGGSSAGASASVAAGVTPFALGTDGGGSARLPSSFCGIFGIKPQFGRIPFFPFGGAPSINHMGIFSRTVRDAAFLLSVLSGFDDRDPSSLQDPVPDFIGACDQSLKGVRVAYSPTLGYAKPAPSVIQATSRTAKILENLGCIVEEIQSPFVDSAEIWLCEATTTLRAHLTSLSQEQWDLIDPQVVDLVENTPKVSAEEYVSLYRKRLGFREQFRAFMRNYDLLLTPTTPDTAPDAVSSQEILEDAGGMIGWGSYTYPYNLTGFPAANLPAGFTSDGMPIGVQLGAAMNQETIIFRAAAALETTERWKSLAPVTGLKANAPG